MTGIGRFSIWGAAVATFLLSTAVLAQPPAPTPDVFGRLSFHRVQRGDVILDLTMQYKLGYVEVLAANPDVHRWDPRPGQMLLLPTAHILPDIKGPGIVINLGDMRLYYFKEHGQLVRSYPIAIGREAHETPKGELKIGQKRKNPVWRPTAQHRKEDPSLPEEVPAGPNNPLGSHALRIGWSEYLIHGTNNPLGIGRRASRGCIRMYPEHIAELYNMVEIGTKVYITDEPVKVGHSRGELFIEVHPAGREIDQIENTGVVSNTAPALDKKHVEWLIFQEAGQDISRVDWQVVSMAILQRRGIPVQITR